VASPKEKIPPSEATSQLPVVGVGVAGLTVRAKVHAPVSPLVSLSPPLTVWVPGASEVAALIAPVEVTTTSGECAELIPGTADGPGGVRHSEMAAVAATVGGRRRGGATLGEGRCRTQ